jgi:hypothetical protein
MTHIMTTEPAIRNAFEGCLAQAKIPEVVNYQQLPGFREVAAVGVEPNLNSDTTADNVCACVNCPACCAANALQGGRPDCPALASLDVDLQRVVGAWEGLPTHIRKTILALVGFAEPPANANVPANEAGASTPARRSSR